MKLSMPLILKTSMLILCMIHLKGAGQGQDFGLDGSPRSFHGFQLLAANQLLQFNQFQSEFGHEYLPTHAFPLQIGAGWAFDGKNGLGGRLGIRYLPLNFDISYNFQASPDPLIPSYSEFRNDYIFFQALMTFGFLRKEKFELYLAGGLNLGLLVHYSSYTVFSDWHEEVDEFVEFFPRLVGGAALGGGVRYFPGKALFVDLQMLGNFFPGEMERLKFTDLKKLSGEIQLGLGFRI